MFTFNIINIHPWISRVFVHGRGLKIDGCCHGTLLRQSHAPKKVLSDRKVSTRSHLRDMEMTWKWHGNDMEMTWKWHGNDMEMTWKWRETAKKPSLPLAHVELFFFGFGVLCWFERSCMSYLLAIMAWRESHLGNQPCEKWVPAGGSGVWVYPRVVKHGNGRFHRIPRWQLSSTIFLAINLHWLHLVWGFPSYKPFFIWDFPSYVPGETLIYS